MHDYADIIYLMGAMLIFSLLSLQANRMFLTNTKMRVETEVEYHAVALAQDYADQILWMDSNAELQNFVSEYPKDVDAEVGEGQTLPFWVDLKVEDYTLTGSNVTNKRVIVIVKSRYLGRDAGTAEESSREVTIEFLTSFAD